MCQLVINVKSPDSSYLLQDEQMLHYTDDPLLLVLVVLIYQFRIPFGPPSSLSPLSLPPFWKERISCYWFFTFNIQKCTYRVQIYPYCVVVDPTNSDNSLNNYSVLTRVIVRISEQQCLRQFQILRPSPPIYDFKLTSVDKFSSVVTKILQE